MRWRGSTDAVTGATAQGARTVGFASSWDGAAFAVAPAPFLGGPGDAWSPTVFAYRAGSILLYTHKGVNTVIAYAPSP